MLDVRVGHSAREEGVADLAVDDRGEDFQAGDAVRADDGGVFGQDREVGELSRLDRAFDVLLLAGVGRAVGKRAALLRR
jgi:hypothetical protein